MLHYNAQWITIPVFRVGIPALDLVATLEALAPVVKARKAA